MNSLTDLNNYGETSLIYTDNRSAAVIFDRASPDNQTYDVAAGQSHSIPLGIEIIEVIKPEVVNVYYEINVSSVSGATVTWPTVPSGCTVTNPTTGVYRISYVNSKAIWDQIKQPNINIPSGYSTNFSYTPSIKYEPSKTKSWSVSIRVTVRAVLTSQFSLAVVAQGFFRRSTAALVSASTVSINYIKGRQMAASLTSLTTMLAAPIKAKLAEFRLTATIVSSATATKVSRATSALSSAATFYANTARSYFVSSTISNTDMGSYNQAFKGVNTIISNDGNWVLDTEYGSQVLGIDYAEVVLFENSSGTLTRRSSVNSYPTVVSPYGYNRLSTDSTATYTVLGKLTSLRTYVRSSTSLSLTQNLTVNGNITGIKISSDGLRVVIVYRDNTTSTWTLEIYSNSSGTLSLIKTIYFGQGSTSPPSWNSFTYADPVSIDYASDTSNYYVTLVGVDLYYLLGGTHRSGMVTWRSGNSYNTPVTITGYGSISSFVTPSVLYMAVINSSSTYDYVDIFKRTSGSHTWQYYKSVSTGLSIRYIRRISISNNGNTVYISYVNDPTGATPTGYSGDGSVYVYELVDSDYVETSRLTLNTVNEANQDSFGQAMTVSSNGKFMVIGYTITSSLGGTIRLYRDSNQV